MPVAGIIDFETLLTLRFQVDEIEAVQAQRQERVAEMQARETPRLSPVSRVDTPGASSMRLVPASAPSPPSEPHRADDQPEC